MPENTWRTLDNGQIEVNGNVPTFGGQHRAALQSQVIDRWGNAATAAAQRYGIPVHWIVGTIYRESGGNPKAKSADGGIGLMQLTSKGAKAGRSDAELLSNPELNIRLGVALMAAQRREGDSLVEMASKYNAGARSDLSPHPSSASPWGYRETSGHITGVVTGANTALELGVGGGGPSPDPTKSSEEEEERPTDPPKAPGGGAPSDRPPLDVTELLVKLAALLVELGRERAGLADARTDLKEATAKMRDATELILAEYEERKAAMEKLDDVAKRLEGLPCQRGAA